MQDPSDTRATIARMKLKQLSRQRDELSARYAAILATAGATSGPAERVAALYEGLRALELAGSRVHPDLPDLRAVLPQLRHDAAPAAAWEARLRAELTRGRTRSAAVHVFGALLDQHASAPPRAEAVAPTHATAYLDRVAAPLDADALPDALRAGGLFDEVLAGPGWDRAPQPGDDPSATAALLEVPLAELLTEIASDPERSPTLRAEARGFEESEGRVALADALQIILSEAETWTWPADGVALRAVQTGDRVRLHPDLRLVDLLFLQQLGAWLDRILPDLRTGHAARRARLAKLTELGAPTVILDNERRALRAELGPLNDPRGVDPTTDLGSVLARRETALLELADRSRREGARRYVAASVEIAPLVHAEIAFRRCSGAPVFVVRTDVEQFFPSIDHRLLLRLAARFGVPERARALLARILAAPLRTPEGPRIASRGVLLGLRLSRLFADLLLGCGEAWVRRRAPGVLAIRLVDDLAFVGGDPSSMVEAWRAWQAYLAACGLRPNADKTGSVAIGADLPEGLPRGPVRWGPLALTAAGWRADPGALAALATETRSAMESAASVLASVQAFNRSARFLVEALAPGLGLGWGGDHGHADRVAAAVHELQSRVVPGGVEAWLRSRLDQIGAATAELPRGWLYWPVTAGGLGLYDPLLEVSAHTRVAVPPPNEPADAAAESRSAAWGAWYGSLLERATPSAPAEDAVSKALVEDFIQRGGELRGSAQGGLSPYWRWVLATCGPDIIETFGTYRFLPQRLLPLDLVRGIWSSDEPR